MYRAKRHRKGGYVLFDGWQAGHPASSMAHG
jgi:hypothetical protein